MKFTLFAVALFLIPSSYANDFDYRETINSAARIIEHQFYSEKTGIRVAGHIKQDKFAKQFSTVINHQEFADLFSKELRRISGDNHIGIVYSPKNVKRYQLREQAKTDEKAKKENKINQANQLRESKRANFGVQGLIALEGNVGYLEMSYFDGFVDESAPVLQSAMDFLSNSQAIILDLRRNGGGNSRILPLFLGYFLGPESVHFGNKVERWKNHTTELYTKGDIQGTRFFDKPIYILTSGTTFSLAEHVTYHLKAFGRATVVGERTYGGGKAFDPVVLNDDFYLRIPRIEMVNTVTKSMYIESEGIYPDVSATAESAFDVAYILALENLKKMSHDDHLVKYYSWVQRVISANVDKEKLNFQLPLFTHQYKFDEFELEIRKNDMWMSFRNLPWVKLVNLGNGYFYDDRAIQQQINIKQVQGKFELHVHRLWHDIRVIKES